MEDSRLKAREKNEPHYFTNRPCKHGHISKRFTSSGACCECSFVSSEKWKVENREHSLSLMKDSYWRQKKKYDEGSRRWAKNNPLASYLIHLRANAKKRGIEFDITLDDLPEMPTHCPVLGIPVYWGRGKGGVGNDDHLISLDRIDNTKGYTKDNIMFISRRANSLKRDASFEEVEKIYLFYKELVQRAGVEPAVQD